MPSSGPHRLPRMAEIVEKVMDGLAGLPAATSMDDVFAADERARRAAAEMIR